MTEIQKTILAACQRVKATMDNQPFPCLYPGCGETPIGSHSQQRGGALKWIARGDCVCAIRRNNLANFIDGFTKGGEQSGIKLQKLAEVTTFPGFCNKHDTSLFLCIEQSVGLTQNNPNQALALHLRAVSYVYAMQRYQLNWLVGMCDSLPRNLWNKYFYLQVKDVINWGIMLPHDKLHYIDPCFSDDAVEQIEWVWRVIPENIGVSCATCIPPLDDEDADRIVGELINYENRTMRGPRPLVSLSVVPERERTHVVVVWNKCIGKYVREYAQIASSNDPQVFQGWLNDAIFNRSEDFTLSPSLWESFDEDIKKKIECLIMPEHLRKGTEVPLVLSINRVV